MTNLSASAVEALVCSSEPFPVIFDNAWQWIGYSSKQAAKKKLTRNFEAGIDYLSKWMNVAHSNGSSATKVEAISLTLDCFKSLAMMAGTAKGKEVRRYFLECERRLQQFVRQPVTAAPEPSLVVQDTFNIQTVFRLVSENPGITPLEVVARSGINPNTVRSSLVKLHKQGIVLRNPRGHYSATGKPIRLKATHRPSSPPTRLPAQNTAQHSAEFQAACRKFCANGNPIIELLLAPTWFAITANMHLQWHIPDSSQGDFTLTDPIILSLATTALKSGIKEIEIYQNGSLFSRISPSMITSYAEVYHAN
ncbi:hypothetical protein ACQ4M4_12820 [Leptolyngbya sp. AN02str]|uniref:winged helix-turn-helix domain-containing protein n=1 Tax=Leptolyngbya sp. AN02str TaxID=3423363 RepID=UPI003D31E27F